MKKARVVEMPDDFNLSYKDYDRLKKHARNSSYYNATKYARNSAQIKDKLLQKGYKDDLYTITKSDGEKFTINFIQDAIDHLIKIGILDDYDYAEKYALNRLQMGYGLTNIRAELFKKKVDRDIIDEIMDKISEDYDDEIDDALERAFNNIINTYAITNAKDTFTRKQKIIQSLMRKGFNYSDITGIIDDYYNDGA